MLNKLLADFVKFEFRLNMNSGWSPKAVKPNASAFSFVITFWVIFSDALISLSTLTILRFVTCFLEATGA